MTTSPSDPTNGGEAVVEEPVSGESGAPADADNGAETAAEPEVTEETAPTEDQPAEEQPDEERAGEEPAEEQPDEEQPDEEPAEDQPAGEEPAEGQEPAEEAAEAAAEGAAVEEAAADEAAADEAAADELARFAAELAEALGATGWDADHGTVRVKVDRDRWHGAVAAASGRLPFFSWLSAVDWAREVAVGEPAEGAEELEERYEVLCRLSSVTDASGAIVMTDVPKDDPWMPSIVDLLPGAGWHEREAAEMFGLDFRGNPNKKHLYLPDRFEGHPLRKSYPLLSREVKPWPGTVDVEGMPGTANVEAGEADTEGDGTEGEDDEA